MTKIATFDKPTARVLGADVAKELAAFCEARGIAVAYAGGTLDGSRFTMKLAFDVVGIDKAAEDFKKHAPSWGIPADKLGATFTSRGNAYRVVGFQVAGKGSASKPILAENLRDGKRYLFDPFSVKRLLGIELEDWEKPLAA